MQDYSNLSTRESGSSIVRLSPAAVRFRMGSGHTNQESSGSPPSGATQRKFEDSSSVANPTLAPRGSIPHASFADVTRCHPVGCSGYPTGWRVLRPARVFESLVPSVSARDAAQAPTLLGCGLALNVGRSHREAQDRSAGRYRARLVGTPSEGAPERWNGVGRGFSAAAARAWTFAREQQNRR